MIKKLSFFKKLFIAGIFCILMFTLFSYQVQHGGYKKMDFDTTVKIQDTILKSGKLRMIALVDTIAESAVLLVSPEVSVVWVLLLTALSFMKLSFIDRRKWQYWVRGMIIPLLFLFLVLAEVYGKSVVHHPSPPFFMMRNPTTIFPKYYINEQFSYPSGHAARAVFLSLLSIFLLFSSLTMHQLSFLYKQKVRFYSMVALIFFTILICVSKIYLGHHWLTDIIGGSLLGIGLSLLSLFLFRYIKSV